jgi:hypothetical protein
MKRPALPGGGAGLLFLMRFFRAKREKAAAGT